MARKETIKKCENRVYFCAFCEEEWKMGASKEFNVEVAIAACSVCEASICERHSLIRHGKRRCRDQGECHAVVPEHDEGGGD